MNLRQLASLAFIAFATVLMIACSVCGSLGGDQRITPESLRATAEVESFLTTTHGAEVRNAIENFESKWLSLDAHQDPSIQSELATGQFLDYYGYARLGMADEPFWLVTKAVVVKSIRVLEYSSKRFKAVACVVELVDETDTAGVFKKSLPPHEFCGVYVFVREDNTWKLAGFFNTADPRDWNYAPDWLKGIIGELPSN